eukprot:Rmarinus@m.19851
MKTLKWWFFVIFLVLQCFSRAVPSTGVSFVEQPVSVVNGTITTSLVLNVSTIVSEDPGTSLLYSSVLVDGKLSNLQHESLRSRLLLVVRSLAGANTPVLQSVYSSNFQSPEIPILSSELSTMLQERISAAAVVGTKRAYADLQRNRRHDNRAESLFPVNMNESHPDRFHEQEPVEWVYESIRDSEWKWFLNAAWDCPLREVEPKFFGRVDDRHRHMELLRWVPTLHGAPFVLPSAAAWMRVLANQHISFVGDSLSRNQYIALFCSLHARLGDEIEMEYTRGMVRGFEKTTSITARIPGINAQISHRYVEIPVVHPLETAHACLTYPVDGIWVLDRDLSDALDTADVVLLNFASHLERINFFFHKPKYPNLPGHTELLEEMSVALRRQLARRPRVREGEVAVLFRSRPPRHFSRMDGVCSQTAPQHQEAGFSPRQLLHPEDVVVPEAHLDDWIAAANNYIMHRILVDEAPVGERFVRWVDVADVTNDRPDAHVGWMSELSYWDCVHFLVPGVADYWNMRLYEELLKDTRIVKRLAGQ